MEVKKNLEELTLERQDLDTQSNRSLECSTQQVEVEELDKMLHGGTDENDLVDSVVRSFQNSSARLDSLKKELAAKLRSIVSLKLQLDEVPSQAELIQYELRFSELNNQIQKKHRQTRKHYDTYNALMEIKELMLKETSLLNSISLQFQDAITSVDGRNKLIHSLEGISKGIQQKLEKVQLTLQSEEKVCNSIKAKYAKAISEQRRNSSLLKLFQSSITPNLKNALGMRDFGLRLNLPKSKPRIGRVGCLKKSVVKGEDEGTNYKRL